MSSVVSFEKAKKKNDVIKYVLEHEEKRDEIMKKLCEYYEMDVSSSFIDFEKNVYYKFCYMGLDNPKAGKLKKKEDLPEKEQEVYDLVVEWFRHRNIVNKYFREGIRTPNAIERHKEMMKFVKNLTNKAIDRRNALLKNKTVKLY